MAAPPCCSRPFALDREVKVDVCHTSDVVSVCPVQSCIVEGAPGHNRWGVAETPLPAKSQGRTGDCTFLRCRVSFKAHSHTAFKDVLPSTQLSRMFRHPHETQELHLGGHPTTHSGTVPMNGREQTQELHLSKVPLRRGTF